MSVEYHHNTMLYKIINDIIKHQGLRHRFRSGGVGGGGGKEGGADITLKKPTCHFAIVKSGLDQTSKCSRSAIVCLIQSAAAVGFQNYIMCTVIWLVMM